MSWRKSYGETSAVTRRGLRSPLSPEDPIAGTAGPFAAQQMVMLLGALAHNVLVWSKRWLTPVPRLASYGALRLVRDVFGIGGLVELAADGAITGIILNKGAPQAHYLGGAFRSLLRPQHIVVGVEKI